MHIFFIFKVKCQFHPFFAANNTSSFRGVSSNVSPNRAAQPTLADLEFPPPPSDLPPPPEEFTEPTQIINNHLDNHHNHHLPPMSPMTEHKKLLKEKKVIKKDDDVSNTEPSVEEASSRFGVSLRKREPSTDSCSSVKSSSGLESAKKGAQSPLSLTSPSVETKSPSSDVPNVGSPCTPPPPPLPAMDDEDKPQKLPKALNPIMKEMELKLVAEIKERADQKLASKNIKDSPPHKPNTFGDPASQLVSELAESLNLDKSQIGPSGLRRNIQTTSNLPPKPENGVSNTGFKPLLKKVDTKKATNGKDDPKTHQSGAIIDFKSRLRKVDSSDKKSDEEDLMSRSAKEDRSHDEGDDKKRESNSSIDANNLKIEDASDDKRRSTGSINSLKKLWEPNAAGDGAATQSSPKLASKNKNTVEETENDSTEDCMSKSMFNKSGKIWPPSSDDKPVVPIKPAVKPIKPSIQINNKLPAAIYATPIAPVVAPAKPKDTSSEIKEPREAILEISQALESSLSSIRLNQNVSSSTWLQLSDKLGLFHSSCVNYSESIPPQTKFHFRELLAKLETQARGLRSASTRNVQENTRFLNEITNTVKGVVNSVQR